jgi:hypothetical protein
MKSCGSQTHKLLRHARARAYAYAHAPWCKFSRPSISSSSIHDFPSPSLLGVTLLVLMLMLKQRVDMSASFMNQDGDSFAMVTWSGLLPTHPSLMTLRWLVEQHVLSAHMCATTETKPTPRKRREDVSRKQDAATSLSRRSLNPPGPRQSPWRYLSPATGTRF